MDEMKIEGKLARGVAAKLLSRFLKKKYGYNVKIRVNGANASSDDEKTRVHLDIDAQMDNAEFQKLLEKIGLY